MTDQHQPWPQLDPRGGNVASGAGWVQPPAQVSRRPEPETEPDPDMPRVLDATLAAPPADDLAPAPAGAAPARTCLQCGGAVGAEGYCEVCGAKAPSERDHFTENPATWVGGACDRGIRHSRNEDAMALAADAEPGSRAVVVVCDGVSSSKDSDVASLAGARAARDLLDAQRPAGMAVPASRTAALAALLTQAAASANDAVIAHTDPDSHNAASATFVAAVVEDGGVVHANLGDSRAYWVGDDGDAALLTTDDSLAQEEIASGVARREAESGAHSHTITKWLGRDAVDVVPTTGSLLLPGPGWVLLCSDGLWNYCSDPADLGRLVAERISALPAVAPVPLAESLVAWANEQGGIDNITVALVRVGPVPERVDTVSPDPEAPDAEAPTTRLGRAPDAAVDPASAGPDPAASSTADDQPLEG